MNEYVIKGPQPKSRTTGRVLSKPNETLADSAARGRDNAIR